MQSLGVHTSTLSARVLPVFPLPPHHSEDAPPWPRLYSHCGAAAAADKGRPREGAPPCVVGRGWRAAAQMRGARARPPLLLLLLLPLLAVAWVCALCCDKCGVVATTAATRLCDC